jgi:hypothetical protein
VAGMMSGQRRTRCRCGRLKPKRMQVCSRCFHALPSSVRRELHQETSERR